MLSTAAKLIFLALSTWSSVEGRSLRDWVSSTETANTNINDASSVLNNNRRELLGSGTFAQQTCNLEANGAELQPECVPWSFGTTSESEVVIPCGECYTMSGFTAGQEITIGGLNILGKLEFPDGTALTLKTPYIFVQGSLKMESIGSIGASEKIKIILTGDTDVMFTPNGNNAALCPSGGCNVGSRPVVVAGGKVDLHGMHRTCPAWTYSHHVDTPIKHVDASAAYEGVAKTPIFFDFEDGIDTWFGNLGAKAVFVNGTDTDGISHLKVFGRSASWQGPFYDIPVATRTVMSHGHSYIWSAKVKLSRDDGQPINCVTSGTDCLSLQINRMTNDDKIAWFDKEPRIPVTAADTWEVISGVLVYTESEISPDHTFAALSFRGPEAGVDISVDDFKLFNRDVDDAEQAALSGISVCENMIRNGNGDEFASSNMVLPFISWFRNETLTLEQEDDGNNYFYLKDRHMPYSSIKWEMDPECAVAGAKYAFSMRIWVESASQVIPRVMKKIVNPEGSETRHSFDLLARCPPTSNTIGWVECRSYYSFSNIHELATSLEVLIVIPGDSYSSVKYDDMNFVPYSGLMLPPNTDGCWGPSASVLIGSQNGFGEEQLATIYESDGGSVSFTTPVAQPVPMAANEHFPTEIALLSRNIAFESDSATSGGHFMVLRSPEVNIIEGIAFKGFGQEGIRDRYPINFHNVGSTFGSRVLKNAITGSHQRCIVLSGTSELNVLENVAYNNKGHCYVLQDGSEEGNKLDKNFGAKTMAAVNVIDGESDHNPATFYIKNPVNSFSNNIAAGSVGSGFWFDLSTSVTGDNAADYVGVNPSRMKVDYFDSNRAHSNAIGLRTYPGEFHPPDYSVFSNTIVYRNTEKGMYFHNSANIQISSGVVADNLIGIDIEFADNVKIMGTEINGNTGNANPCPDNTTSLIGIKMSPNTNDPTLTGARLQDIIFKNFQDSRCASSVGAFMNENRLSDVFNANATFTRLHFENVETRFSVCEAITLGLQQVRIEDNGSLNPYGNYKGHIVSEDLKLGYNLCEELDTCTSYCYDEKIETDDCHRTVTVNVDPEGTGNIQLVLLQGSDTQFADGSLLPVDQTMYDNRRSYSMALPPGNYTASFRDATTSSEAWPRFAEIILDDAPLACKDYMENVELVPMQTETTTCDDLVINGDFSSGQSNWFQMGAGIKIVAGYSNLGSGLSTDGRNDPLKGLGQNLDTRCMELGKKYEIKAKVRMVSNNGGADPTCSYQKTGAGDDNCPRANIKSSIAGVPTYIDLAVGKMNVPWVAGDWNFLYGSFTVTPIMNAADHVALYFDGPDRGIDIEIDDVEIYSHESICNDLATNGDFYEGTKDWSFIGHATGIELVPGVSGFALSTISREQWFHGMSQEIDSRCLIAENSGREYEVTAAVKLTDASGSPADCDPFNYYFSPKACPVIALRLLNRDNGSLKEIREIAQTVGPWSSTGWNKIYGRFELTDDLIYEQANLNYYVTKAWAGINIVVDDIAITPVAPAEVTTAQCTQLIKNGDAEIGDARDWYIKGSGNIGSIDMISPGATGNYAFYHHGTRSQLFNGMMQKLPRECMDVNSVWKISFKMRIVNADGNEVACDKSLAGYVGDTRENCPEVYIESKTRDGGTKVTNLNNQHTDEFWIVNQWNNFEVIFTMTNQHRILDETFIFIHKIKLGYGYKIDDFEMVPYTG